MCLSVPGRVVDTFRENELAMGKVDFGGVFKVLKTAGFDGPLMVECCKIGATAEETTANARANRTFLETVLARV